MDQIHDQILSTYLQVIQRYYVQYLTGYDAIALSELIQSMHSCPEEESVILSATCNAISNLSPDELHQAGLDGSPYDFRGLRLDWCRLQVGAFSFFLGFFVSGRTGAKNQVLLIYRDVSVFQLVGMLRFSMSHIHTCSSTRSACSLRGLSVFLTQAYTSCARSSLPLHEHRRLAVLLNTVCFHTKMVDFLDHMQSDTSDLSVFCFYARVFEDWFNQGTVFSCDDMCYQPVRLYLTPTSPLDSNFRTSFVSPCGFFIVSRTLWGQFPKSRTPSGVREDVCTPPTPLVSYGEDDLQG